MKKFGLLGLSFLMAGLILALLIFGMAGINPISVMAAKNSPSAVCSVPGVYTTIQSAIDDVTCDEIVIAAGTFSESLVITRSVTIQGAGSSSDPSQTILNNDLKSRVVEIPNYGWTGADIVVSISDLNIEEGYASGSGFDSSGGGIFNEENLTLDNVYMINNYAHKGGGLYTYGTAITTIMNSYIGVNSTYGTGAWKGDNIYNGAALGMMTIISSEIATAMVTSGFSTYGKTFIYDSEINGNSSGGLYVFNASLTMENTDITSNGQFGMRIVGDPSNLVTSTIISSLIENSNDTSLAGNYGTGIHAIDNVHLTITDTTIQGNHKEGIFGEKQGVDSPVITITNSIIRNNLDGGIESDGDITILDSKVTSNVHSYNGFGGIFVDDAELWIARSEITRNVGFSCGGGVKIKNGVARIRDTTIAYNMGENGVGLCISYGGDVRVRRSAIFSNTATGNGGGIQVGSQSYSGTLLLANSTVAHNYADEDGGGIYAESGELDLTNVTIAKNYADADNASGGDGGGFLVDTTNPVQFDMVNTLVATNKLGNGDPSDCYGTITSAGTNLIRVANSCSGLIIGTDLYGFSGSPLNANLKPIQDRGGYTWVIPFRVNSPAADAGNQSVCTSTPINSHDQRNYSRIGIDGNEDGGIDGDNCDIGAFERNAAPVYMVFMPLILK